MSDIRYRLMTRRLSVLLLAAGLVLVSTLWLQHFSLEEQGERIFVQRGCVGCHFSGGGPNLTHVVRKHNDAMLNSFISDPESVYRARNEQSLNDGFGHMPRIQTTPKDVRAIIAYLHQLDKQPDK